MNILLKDIKVDPSWTKYMKLYGVKDIEKVTGALIYKEFYPKADKVLRFLETDLKNVKYIILGMDPYPQDYIDENGDIVPVATGRSFEVANVSDWQEKFPQASLRNILKTVYYNETGEIKDLEKIRKEIADGRFFILPPHEWFNSLEKQGVLFLNATLTVVPGKPDSHTEMWKGMMSQLIRYIFTERSDIKWLIWGDKAYNRVKDIVSEDSVIRTSHPRVARFVNENCFKQTEGISWTGIN